MKSPIESLGRLGAELGIELWCKRDDLLPLSGGGNKVRKLERIFARLMRDRATAVITNGAIGSNHARVTALMCAKLGIRCELILHAEDLRNDTRSPNLELMELSGASVHVGDATEIAPTIERLQRELTTRGERVSVIPGGAHHADGVEAYADAVLEVANQLEGFSPEFVVVASGTGATQAGLIVGALRVGWRSRVIGVSVARKHDRGARAVAEACSWSDAGASSRVEFFDEWVGAGYGRASAKVWSVIERVARLEGLVLDPVYTGKAMTGLVDLVARGEIAPRSKVLFWHTGGLLNLLEHRPPHTSERRSS